MPSAWEYYNLLKGRAALACVLSLFWSSNVIAQIAPLQVPCSNSGITVHIPQEWEAVAVQNASVRCAFKNGASGFPTLNIMEEPAHPSERSIKQRTEELVRSYHLVGLTDAKALSSGPVTIDGHEAFRAVIRYTTQYKAMIAVITLIPLGERLYTVTALDLADAYRVSEKQLAGLSDGLTITAPSPLPPKQAEIPSDSNQKLFLGGVIFLAIILVTVLFNTRMPPTSENH